MKPVERDSLLDIVTYAEQRDEIRRRALEIKESRRVHVGDWLTFLFENTETMRYQVLEMMRTERIVRERDIQHELDTYNELLGAPGELGCTLLIEIDDAAERDVKLRAWLTLPEHVYVRTSSGRRVRARVDGRQVGESRLSSVQYLKFALGGESPVAVGADHPELTEEAVLTAAQRAALETDLAQDAPRA